MSNIKKYYSKKNAEDDGFCNLYYEVDDSFVFIGWVCFGKTEIELAGNTC